MKTIKFNNNTIEMPRGYRRLRMGEKMRPDGMWYNFHDKKFVSNKYQDGIGVYFTNRRTMDGSYFIIPK